MSRIISAMVVSILMAFAASAATTKPTFDELDTNKDGKLSKDEAAKVESLDFAKADVNKDGVIDRAEYEIAVG